MDGASGAIAVVSLAVQLVATVQHITKLFRSIRGSPKQLSHLVETLDQLRDNLDSARLFIDKHITNNGLSDTLLAVTNALKRCQSKVTMLEEFVNKVRTYLDCQSGIRKSLGSLKIVMKREDMQEILSQVRDATDGLQTAVSISSAILINE